MESYWSLTSQLTPYCFVQPENTEEVSAVVKTLVSETHCKFAVRSGGHSSNAGANNIENGVTIDLGRVVYVHLELVMNILIVRVARLNNTEYDPATQLASLRPGSRWLDVYRTLDPLDVGVQGGEVGSVGVGGLLLGGGFSPYLYQRGFATDDIHTLEVVLANGSIVEASAEENNDLYRVLKGGGNGFGIVTRFDMRTFERVPIWSAYREFPESADADEAHVRALRRWTDNPEAYQSGAALVWWTYRPKIDQTIIISAVADTLGRVEPLAVKELLSIPGYNVSEMGLTNMSTLALATQAEGYR